MLTMVFVPGSSSMAAHTALHQIGVRFEPRPIWPAWGEQHAPTFPALTSEGEVPVLPMDGSPLMPPPEMLPNLTTHDARMTPPPGVQRTSAKQAAIGYQPPA